MTKLFHLLHEKWQLAIEAREAISFPFLLLGLGQRFWIVFGLVVQEQVRQTLVIKRWVEVGEMVCVGISYRIT